MDLVERVKSLVSGRQEQRYEYECDECGNVFESTVANPNDTSCPDCGSERVFTSL